MGGAMMGLGTGLEQLGAMLGQFGMGQIKNKQDQESKWQEAMMGVGINPKTGQQDPEFLRAAETFYKAKGYSPKEQAEAALLERLGGLVGGGGIGGGMPRQTAPVDENQAAIEWLKANPNDPMADAVRKKLGM